MPSGLRRSPLPAQPQPDDSDDPAEQAVPQVRKAESGFRGRLDDDAFYLPGFQQRSWNEPRFHAGWLVPRCSPDESSRALRDSVGGAATSRKRIPVDSSNASVFSASNSASCFRFATTSSRMPFARNSPSSSFKPSASPSRWSGTRSRKNWAESWNPSLPISMKRPSRRHRSHRFTAPPCRTATFAWSSRCSGPTSIGPSARTWL